MKSQLTAPGTERLKLTYDNLLSKCAFKFNLRPYIMAAMQGRLDVVQMLITAGADIDNGTPWGTPLTIAERGGHLAVIDRLVLAQAAAAVAAAATAGAGQAGAAGVSAEEAAAEAAAGSAAWTKTEVCKALHMLGKLIFVLLTASTVVGVLQVTASNVA
jgi:hypothetical protein